MLLILNSVNIQCFSLPLEVQMKEFHSFQVLACTSVVSVNPGVNANANPNPQATFN